MRRFAFCDSLSYFGFSPLPPAASSRTGPSPRPTTAASTPDRTPACAAALPAPQTNPSASTSSNACSAPPTKMSTARNAASSATSTCQTAARVAPATTTAPIPRRRVVAQTCASRAPKTDSATESMASAMPRTHASMGNAWTAPQPAKTTHARPILRATPQRGNAPVFGWAPSISAKSASPTTSAVMGRRRRMYTGVCRCSMTEAGTPTGMPATA